MANIREDIRSFINSNVSEHPSDIALITAQKFGISRQRVNAYLTREIKNGKIIKTGRTSSTRYYLVDGNKLKFSLKLSPDLAEDRVWTKYVKPMLLKYPRNIYNVCYYGFTEILNNAIDHSNGTLVYISIEIKNDDINIEIIDNGIGIFKKIQNALNLESDRESILHLSKGKFTTDPKNHTGEGIFFTSRIFDNFSIFSGNLFYIFKNEDWFHSSERREEFGKGTLMNMHISLNSKKTAKEVMDKYTDEEIGFTKTIVSVALSADPGDPHVSRSQAKRLMVGLDKFKTIVLDFNGVKSVGQAFVDEVFRVFKNEHPNIKIHFVRANDDIEAIIKRGTQSPGN